ncbi:MAG: hypothetical protein KDN19_21275 [Verrucomicrobiae bacterium]|nr:hypothetical protein [Verrucomicrobiae bacterium]
MNREPLTHDELETLAGLLRRRVEIIRDTEWRDRDPAGHLEGLKTVSESIMAQHEALKGRLPPRLEHFFSNCSYGKALDFIENELIS